MSEAKFTKGPWDIEIGCSQAFVTTENKFIHESIVDIATGNRDERVANAHLIAAAPEMYEMLEHINLTLGDEYSDELDKIEVILAKARGEQ